MSIDKYNASNTVETLSSSLNIYIPLSFVLILVAVIDTAQSFLVYFKGEPTLINFMRILTVKTFYCIHFLVFVFIIRLISKRLQLNKKSVLMWSILHFSAMVGLILIHQAIFMELNYLVWNGNVKSRFFDLIFSNPNAWLDVLIYMLLLVGYFLMELRRTNSEKELQLSVLEVQYLKSKLNELRNKIHPQFLFNTMGIISDLIKKGKNKDANYVLSLLSDFLRTTVYGSEKEEITLEEELKFVNEFLEIEKMRFKNGFAVIKKIDAKLMSAIIPNFILQPVIEEMINRIKDFTISGYEIIISAGKFDAILTIILEDNIEIILERPDIFSENDSMVNITNERLSQIYGQDYQLQVRSKKNGGEERIIKLPLYYQNETDTLKYQLENIR